MPVCVILTAIFSIIEILFSDKASLYIWITEKMFASPQRHIPYIIRVAGRRRRSDTFVWNEFEQPKAACGEGQGCPSSIPRRLLWSVAGVSEEVNAQAT
ncbi:hypothetical protein FNI11_11735 [Salmonella enterica subsp. salamae]|nr:hypothetical protein [Salmonella enterica subsp. salamae]ECJ2280718.1 hypothetical protein [Salmonella enterica subsp. salamae]